MEGLWTNGTGFGRAPIQLTTPISPALLAYPMIGFIQVNVGLGEPTPWGEFVWSDTNICTGTIGNNGGAKVGGTPYPSYILGDDGLETFTTLDAARPYFRNVALYDFALVANADYGQYAEFPALDAGALRLLTQTYPDYWFAADAALYRTFKMQTKFLASGLSTTGATPNQAMDNYIANGGGCWWSAGQVYGGAFGPITSGGVNLSDAMETKRSVVAVGGRTLTFADASPAGTAYQILAPYQIGLEAVPGEYVDPTWTMTPVAGATAPRITYESTCPGVVMPLTVVDGRTVFQRDSVYDTESLGGAGVALYHSFYIVAYGVIS